MKIKAVIIDDNPFLAEALSDLLSEDYKEIELIGIGYNGQEGLKLIEEGQPELVFLDVEMPDMNGFEMLSFLKEIKFQIIFITAHSHYAIKAIRFNALDYLVKPIVPAELRQAIKRFQKNRLKESNRKRVELALFNLQQNEATDQVLLLQLQDGDLSLILSQIVRIEGDRNYSIIHLVNHSKKLCAKNLAYFEEILSDKGFFRCHKSHLVNAFHIKAFQKEAFLLKSQELAIPISRRKKQEAKEWFLANQQKLDA